MKKTKEVKIAVVAIIGLVILFFGLNFLKGLDIFSSNTRYQIVFDNVDGLGNNTAIFADGYKVGYVSAINYDYQQGGAIVVDVELDEKLRVPAGTSAEIDKDLMGNMHVNLLMGNNPREAILPGGVIDGRMASGALAKAAEMLPAIEKILPKLDSILGSLQTLLADPSISASLHNVETITDNLATTTSEANQLMATLNDNAPNIMAKATNVMGNAETLTSQLAKVDVNATMSLVNQTLSVANETIEKVSATMSDVNKLTTSLNNQEGSLGLLMKDAQLYNNLNCTMRSADSLLTDLKSHPKRYVHFSIFGKKDK